MSRRLLGLLGLLVVLSGCGSQSQAGSGAPNSTGSSDHIIESGDYTIYVHPSSERAQAEALVEEATLGLRHGCVVLKYENENPGTPVVWPTGTSIASTDPFVLDLPSGEELAVGDQVTGSGGRFSQVDGFEEDIPERCLSENDQILSLGDDISKS